MYQKRLLIFIGSVTLIVILLVALRQFIFEYQEDFYSDRKAHVLSASDLQAGFRDISIDRSNNQHLSAIYYPAPGGRIVVMLHGTSADGASLLPEARILASGGIGVLSLDLPGTGGSDGAISWSSNECNAVFDAVNWLSNSAPTKKNLTFGVYGFSMGAMIALQVAVAEPRIHAIALAGTMTTITSSFVHQAGGPVHFLRYAPWLAASVYGGLRFWRDQPEDLIDMVSNRPILLISGLKDSINPPEMTRTLFARAKEPKESLFLENVGHGGYADASPEIFHKKIVNFFETYL